MTVRRSRTATRPRPAITLDREGPAPANGGRANPYFGLEFYREEDERWFFGRGEDTNRLITNLLASRLTLLHADSGVGKSSLLRAGVACQLRPAPGARDRSDAAVYVPVVFSDWKDNPVRALCAAIADALCRSGFPDAQAEPAEHLADAINRAGAAGAILLVILDQFEEYFQYTATEAPAPERFADELAEAVNRSELPVSFLISIRENAYAGLGDLLKHRIPNVYGNYLHVDYLGRTAAEEAIRGPVRIYNQQPGVAEPVTIEDDLVTAVLEQVPARTPYADISSDGSSAGDGGDAQIDTPLLQLVMQTIWEREVREGSCALRRSTLDTLEGAQAIVHSILGRALEPLSNSDRRIALDALDHLVTPDGGKVAASVSDLAARDGHNRAEVRAVLDRLESERVLRSVAAAPGRDPVWHRRYEIFHDVLAWPIAEAVISDEQRRERDRRRGERRLLRRVRRTTYLAGAVCVIALIAIGAGIFAEKQRQQATASSRLAQSLELASFSAQVLSQNPSLSALLARRAVAIKPTLQAQAALRTAVGALGPVLRDNAGAMYAAGFSPDARLIVTATAHGIARIWTATPPYRSVATLRTHGGSQLNSAAFNPGGRRIVTAGADGMARIWSATSGREIRTLAAGPGGLNRAAFSPDGRLIVTASADGQTRVWNDRTGRHFGARLQASPGSVNSASFSPDGALILTAGASGTARLWSVASRRLVDSFRTGDTAPLSSAAFNPQGTLVIAGSADGSAWIWRIAGGRLLRELRGATGAIYSASFNADGSLILTASADGTARIWGAPDGRQLALLRGSFATAAFSPDGRTLVTAGFDGTARLPGTGIDDLIGPLAPLERIADHLLRGKVLSAPQRALYLVGIGS